MQGVWGGGVKGRCACRAELALVATRVAVAEFVRVRCECEPVDQAVDDGVDLLCGEASEPAEHGQDLTPRHVVDQRVVLRAVPDQTIAQSIKDGGLDL